VAKRFEDLIRQMGQWWQANEIRAYVKAIRHAPGRWAPAVSMDQRLGAVPDDVSRPQVRWANAAVQGS
jgi:hypothetical protein